MHRRQIWILNTGLALAVVLLAGRLGSEWKRANLRYSAPSSSSAGSLPLVPSSYSPRPAPDASGIVANNLFTPERNNDLPPEKTAGPPPVAPILFGTMKLGPNYEALAAEGGTPEPRKIVRVKKGQKLGEYTFVEIQDEKVVVEFQGQRTTLDIYQSARSVPRAAAPSAPAAPPVVVAAPSALPPPQGASMPGSTGAGAPSGSSPTPSDVKVTMEGNRKRFERWTPFGPQVWYDPPK